MATNNVIEIIVKVVDQATAGLTKVATQVNALGTRIGSMLPKLSDMAKGWLALGAATAAVTALVGGVRRMFTETAAAERVQTQLAAAIASTGGVAGYTVKQLNIIGKELSRVTVHSTTAIGQMQSLLLTFTEVRGDAFKEASTAAANLAARLGMDLTSAARLVGRALNEPTMGLYALTRSGITFSSAQREMIRELVAGGEKAKAQAVILAELEKRIGGAAAAMRNTFSGAIEAVKNQFAELFQASDGALEPATRALNELQVALENPGLKAGLETLMTWFVKFAVVVAKAGAKIGEFIGGLAVMSNATGDMVEELTNDIERGQKSIADLKKELASVKAQPTQFVWDKRAFKSVEKSVFVKQLEDEIARMEGLVKQWGALQQAVIDDAGIGKVKPKPLSGESEDLTKAIEDSISAYDKQRNSIKDNIAILEGYIATHKNMNDAMLEAHGTSRERFNEATKALTEWKTKLETVQWQKFVTGMKGVTVETQRMTEGMTEAERKLFQSTETDIEHMEREMIEFRANLENAFNAGLLGSGAKAAALFNERWQFYLDKTLKDVEVTVKKIAVPLEELSTAGKRAVESIEQAFADAFMNIDEGFKGLLRSLLQVFQRMIAEAGALRLMKLLRVEDLMKRAEAPQRAADRQWAEEQWKQISIGGPGERPLPEVETAAQTAARRIVEDIQARSAIEGTTAAVQGTTASVERLHEVITAKMLADDPCACMRVLAESIGGATSVDSVAGAVAATTTAVKETTDTVKASSDTVAATVAASADKSSGKINQTLGGLLSKMLSAMMAGGGGGSGGFDWMSLVTTAIGAYFGMAAGGGTKGGITRVGEEGPELALLPGGTRVYNKRQLQFAGAGGGATMNFQPVYNITIEGNTDPAGTQEQLAALLVRRDAKLRQEMNNMLKENGFGRMR